MQVMMFGGSDIGRVRKINQDYFFFNQAQGIAVVADGIGGRKGGEIASRTAVEEIKQSYLECSALRAEEVPPFLTSAVDQANKAILAKGRADARVEGMGTTVDCLLFVGNHVYIAHVGDSRTYLYYKGNLWQLTLDHSIEVYVKRGWLPAEVLQKNSRPGALVRAMGLSATCETDIYDKAIRPGEIYLTCSDGLTGMVGDDKILKILTEQEHRLEAVPKILMAEANRCGGKDNITVVLSKVVA